MKNKGIGGHQSHTMLKDEWCTPPEIVTVLGHFDLDPCSPTNPPWKIADNFYDKSIDGLNQNWIGRVYCNPPYGYDTEIWLKKLADHGNGIALIFARTETKMFFNQVWNKADAILFIEGRLFFHHVDGTKAKSNSGAPSCLIAYGENNVIALEQSGIKGKLIKLK